MITCGVSMASAHHASLAKLFIAVGILVSTAISIPAYSKGETMKELEPLLFLQGHWHGEGVAPFGKYEFQYNAEVRGRWLLVTGEVFKPKTNTVLYVSTQVYGYDPKGLVSQLYDTDGAFEFHGAKQGNGIRLDWKEGAGWKRSEFEPVDGGKVHFRYESKIPNLPKEAASYQGVYEGVWISGKRPAQKP